MSQRGAKRQRTGVSSFVTPKRPIDKGLINISQSLSTTQVQTVLITSTFPCTITGLRWILTSLNDNAIPNLVRWAIVIVRDGLSASTLTSADGTTLYAPEQDVMAFGVMQMGGTGNNTGLVQHDEGNTKSMRKLMLGDKILFITKSATSTGDIDGCVQLFCKS